VSGIDGAVDRGREQDAAAFLQTDKALAPGGRVGAEVRAGDGDEASAVGEARQRRRDVPEGGVGDAALDMNRRRERRVHQHHRRTHAAVEVIVNMRGVKAADRRCREQRVEQSAAGFGEFVQRQLCACEFGEHRQQAGPCRGFQHQIGSRDRRGGRGGEAECDRCRELLKRLGFLRAPCLRRRQRRELAEHGEKSGGRSRAGTHGGAELAQEQNLRRLRGFVGELPIPGAGRIGSAEGRFHRRAQRVGVERVALGQRFHEGGRSLKKGRDGVGTGRRWKQRQGCRGLGRGGSDGCHGEGLRERGMG
jgi:hypothetical protein